jgi:DNA-binding SARP family transcriptional activator/LysM repeat protein
MLGLLTLLVGVPLALAAAVGWPLPHSWPSWTQVRSLLETSGIPDVVLIDTLAVVCWIAWLDFAIAAVVEVVAVITGYPAPRLRVVRPWQPLAARMITAIVVATALMGDRPNPAAAPHPATLAAALAERRPAATNGVRSAVVEMAAGNAAPSEPAATEYHVTHGDTLWDISARQLGDPVRWPAIWQRNAGRAEPDQRRFTDPNLIVPGWTLEVPASQSPGVPSVPSAPQPSRPARPGAAQPTPDAPAQAPSTTLPTSPASTSEPTAPPPQGPTTTRPSPPGAAAASRGATPGIGLPSGGVVGLGLAGSIAMALAAARLHERRRRRVGSPDASGVDRLIGPAIGRLGRAAAASVATASTANADEAVALAPHDLLNALRARACGLAQIPIGVSADGRDQVIVDTDSLSGLALAGAGAERAARALLVTTLAHHRPWRAEVLVTAATASLLDRVPELSNLRVVSDVGAALAALEDELIRRQRALGLRGAVDYRSTMTSVDPMDTLLAFVDGETIGEPESGRVNTVVALGRRLGIAVVVLGDAGAANTITVGDDGSLAPNAPESLRTVGRLFTLSVNEAAEILAVVAAGQGEPVPDAATYPLRSELSASAALMDAPDGPAGAVAELRPTPAPAEGPAPSEATTLPGRPVLLRLFGPPRVEVLGDEVRTGLRGRGRELLCLLAVRREGIRQEEVIDILWPDDDTDWDKTREQLTTAVTSTRRRLRALTDNRGADYILFSGDDRYRLDAGVVDADVWQLEGALHEAARAASDDERLSALERLATLHLAEPLAGAVYPWADAVRERLRRRAVDGLCDLAELCEGSGHGVRAVAALEAARTLDPCREEVYQRLIALHVRLGRDDAAQRAFRELARELSDLGETPTPETAALLRARPRLAARGDDPSTTRRGTSREAAELASASAVDDDDDSDEEPVGNSAMAMRGVPMQSRPTATVRPNPPRLPILDEEPGVERDSGEGPSVRARGRPGT